MNVCVMCGNPHEGTSKACLVCSRKTVRVLHLALGQMNTTSGQNVVTQVQEAINEPAAPAGILSFNEEPVSETESFAEPVNPDGTEQEAIDKAAEEFIAGMGCAGETTESEGLADAEQMVSELLTNVSSTSTPDTSTDKMAEVDGVDDLDFDIDLESTSESIPGKKTKPVKNKKAGKAKPEAPVKKTGKKRGLFG